MKLDCSWVEAGAPSPQRGEGQGEGGEPQASARPRMGHSHPTLSLKGEGYFDSASMKISLRPQGVFAGACFSHLTFLLVAGRYPGRRCRKVHLRLIVGKRRVNPLA